MRDRCEASGLKVKPNADGRGRCPLCGDDWHQLTHRGRLREHRRNRVAAHLTPHEVEVLMEAATRLAEKG